MHDTPNEIDSTRPARQPPDATVQWEHLALLLDAFCDRWEQSPQNPPNIADFIQDNTELTSLALVELIKVDIENRIQRGATVKLLEDYLREWPQLQRDVPVDLLYEDYQARQAIGQSGLIEQYQQAYPDIAPALQRLVEDDPHGTLSVGRLDRPAQIQVGTRIDDFDLLAKLGSGAFATVYLARQVSMQRLVALKISTVQGSEPQMLAQLDHPNIVRVYDQRTATDPANGHPIRLMYMQYVPSGTLHDVLDCFRPKIRKSWNGAEYLKSVDQLLADRGEEPDRRSSMREQFEHSTWPETICLIGAQLAEALNYAHGRGVLHRDIKPANVLLDRDGSPKLVDFNISSSSKVSGCAPSAYFGGSLPYMSPEHLRAFNPDSEHLPDELDCRTDIYSLGVMLIELLSGERPFEITIPTESWSSILEAMTEARDSEDSVESTRRQLTESGHHCSKFMVDTLVGCVHPNPDERYSNAGDLATRLRWAANPQIQHLFRWQDTVWNRWLSWSPGLVTVIISALLSALAAWFVLTYNAVASVPESGQKTLALVGAVINGIAFPLGMATVFLLTRPIQRSLHAAGQTDSVDFQRSSDRNMRIGYLCALVCAGIWLVCGCLFPISLALLGVKLPATAWIDFIASNGLGGMVAAAYGFTVLTYVSVIFWQPSILSNAVRYQRIPRLTQATHQLERWIWVFQVLAIAIPMLAMALLVIRGDESHQFALIVLSLLGLLGFVAQFWLARGIQQAIAAFRSIE